MLQKTAEWSRVGVYHGEISRRFRNEGQEREECFKIREDTAKHRCGLLKMEHHLSVFSIAIYTPLVTFEVTS